MIKEICRWSFAPSADVVMSFWAAMVSLKGSAFRAKFPRTSRGPWISSVLKVSNARNRTEICDESGVFSIDVSGLVDIVIGAMFWGIIWKSGD